MLNTNYNYTAVQQLNFIDIILEQFEILPSCIMYSVHKILIKNLSDLLETTQFTSLLAFPAE